MTEKGKGCHPEFISGSGWGGFRNDAEIRDPETILK